MRREYDKGEALLVNLKMRHAMMVHGAKLQSISMKIYPEANSTAIWGMIANLERINGNLKSENARLVNWYSIDRKLNDWKNEMNVRIGSGVFEWEQLIKETNQCMKEMIAETTKI